MTMLGWVRLRRRSADLRHRFIIDTIDALDLLHERVAQVEAQLREQQATSRELDRRTSRAETEASVARLEAQDLIRQYSVLGAAPDFERPQAETAAEAEQSSELLEGLMPILTPIRSRVASDRPQLRERGHLNDMAPRFEQRLPGDEGSADEETDHICVFATTDGYDLVERLGAAPRVGSVLELDEGQYGEVVKVARSPLPQDRRRCAYLLPVAAPMEEADLSAVVLVSV